VSSVYFTPLSRRFIRTISGTTSGTVGTQTTHAHGGGTIPACYWIKPKSNGVVYESAVADATNVYVKGSAASLTFEAILFFIIP
jgi:hypothetical protein